MKRFQMLLLLLLIFFAGLFFVSIDNNSHNASSYKERPASHAEVYICQPAAITPYTVSYTHLDVYKRQASWYPWPLGQTGW